jgi:hypothetical protein
MKMAVVTGIGTVITAAATAGQLTLAGLGVLLVAAIGVTCWVISDNARTQNAVAIIRAARSGTDPQPATDADQVPGGQVDSGDAR